MCNDPQHRSVTCNGQFLAAQRRARGWTQADLARKAGYTERLVRKAEAGRSVSIQTLHILAQTLSESGEHVAYEDLATDNIALAWQFLRGMYLHSEKVIPMTRHFLATDCVFKFSGDPDVFPFAGTHHGIEAAHRAFTQFFSTLQLPDDKDEYEGFEYMAAESSVFVWGESNIRAIGQVNFEPLKIAMRIDFRNGLLVLFDDRFDTHNVSRHLKPTDGPDDSN